MIELDIEREVWNNISCQARHKTKKITHGRTSIARCKRPVVAGDVGPNHHVGSDMVGSEGVH